MYGSSYGYVPSAITHGDRINLHRTLLHHDCYLLFFGGVGQHEISDT